MNEILEFVRWANKNRIRLDVYSYKEIAQFIEKFREEKT
jgi:hypothetical protein